MGRARPSKTYRKVDLAPTGMMMPVMDGVELATAMRSDDKHRVDEGRNMSDRVFVGTAGWSIPRASALRCPDGGTHLQRYSRIFRCAEINSSFHHPHAAATYAKWAESTPHDFRFAVKVPRTVTHDRQLRRVRVPLLRFLSETDGLGRKRGPLLVQLPPAHSFDARVVGRFLDLLRRE